MNIGISQAWKAALPLAALMALSACANNLYADVARFHANQPINRGTLYLQPADPAMGQSLEFRTHSETVAIQLRRNGFQTVPSADQAQYLGTVDITQTDGTTMTRPGTAASIPAGQSVMATPVGGGPRSSGDRTTTLAVQIKRGNDQAAVWEGRASLTGRAGSTEATLTWAVPALSGALFREFPGTPGVTQQVRL
jgi:hypothetical protein